MIESWKFLQVWERAGVPLLTVAGYSVKGDNALRTQGKGLQLISLERDQRQGGRFTINLAFAHDFARSFRDGKPVQLTGYAEAVFHARLGQLLQNKDVWWPYGNTEPEAEKTILAITQVAIAGADAWFSTLEDPGGVYLTLKKGDLGDENLWHLAVYARALGRNDEAIEWLGRMKSTPSHVAALKKEWGKGA